MLFLVFELETHRFALETAQVLEVLPVVDFRPLPQAPPGIAGVFDYHGQPVPLLDLSLLGFGHPARRRMSTRIILVPCRHAGVSHPLGLLAEKATETLRREPGDFAETGVTVEGAPWLGPVTRDERGLIQRVEVEALLPEAVRAVLFQEGGAPCR